jgi:tetratricopeptide (TPR) repeat protein
MAAVAGLFSAWVERTYIGADGAEFALSAGERLLLAGRILWFYVGKLVWPFDLVFIYPRWTIAEDGWTQVVYLLAALGALAAAWWLRARTRAPLAAALFFGGSLVPVLGFFNVYGFIFSYVADHWQYLPSLGLIVLACSAATRGAARFPGAVRWVVAVGVLGGLGLLSHRQSRMYRDIERFYRTILADNPAAWMAHNNLGGLLRDRGQLDEAEFHFRETLRYRPHSAKAHANLGTLAQDRRRWPEAVEHYQEAVRRAPGRAEYHNHLAGALRETGRLAEAETHHREAVRLDPTWHVAHNNQGVTLRALGRLPEALAAFQRAAQLDPTIGPRAVESGVDVFPARSGRGKSSSLRASPAPESRTPRPVPLMAMPVVGGLAEAAPAGIDPRSTSVGGGVADPAGIGVASTNRATEAGPRVPSRPQRGHLQRTQHSRRRPPTESERRLRAAYNGRAAVGALLAGLKSSCEVPTGSYFRSPIRLRACQ